MKDFSLEHFNFSKVYLIFFLLFCFSCKDNNLDNTKKKGLEPYVKKHEVKKLKAIMNDGLNKKIINFINKNALDSKYKQVYLILFNLRDNDTLLMISKTFMPAIVNKNLEYKGGFNYNDSPILIIDFKKSSGVNYYDYKYLNDSLVKKYKSVEHPTSFERLMKIETYLIKDGDLENIFEDE